MSLSIRSQMSSIIPTLPLQHQYLVIIVLTITLKEFLRERLIQFFWMIF